MASTFAYSNKTRLQNLLLVTIDSSFDATIDSWISAAERRVNKFLGFTTASGLWNEAITDEVLDARVDGDLNLVIYPRKRPINSVSQIELFKGTASINLTLTEGGENKYVLPAQNNCIIFPSNEITSTGEFTLINFADVKYTRFFTKVDYIAGYTAIPEDIQLATDLYAADIFMTHANKEGLVQITQGRVTKRWRESRTGTPEDRKSDFVIEAEEILKPYKIASGWW